MKKLTCAQFLALPEGTYYLDQQPDSTGFSIKGPTTGESFISRSYREYHRMDGTQLSLQEATVQTTDAQEFLVLLAHEQLYVEYVLFNQAPIQTLSAFLDKAFKIIEGFIEMEHTDIQMPDGRFISLNAES
jgi:hypothetical protein